MVNLAQQTVSECNLDGRPVADLHQVETCRRQTEALHAGGAVALVQQAALAVVEFP